MECMNRICDCATYDGPYLYYPPFPGFGPSDCTDPDLVHKYREAVRQSSEGVIRYTDPSRPRSGPKMPESHYRDMLARQVGGQIEVRLPFGIADVMTDTTVWEVEPIERWKSGAAQALRYGAQLEHRGALALYGGGRPGRLYRIWEKLQALPAPGIDLWYLNGETFVHIKKMKPPKPAAA